MFYRSAIEIVEMVYIPDPDVQASMTRVERWKYILRLRSESVGIVRSAVCENGNGLDENNFPEYVRDAYKDCLVQNDISTYTICISGKI